MNALNDEDRRAELLEHYKLANEFLQFQMQQRILEQLQKMDDALEEMRRQHSDFWEYRAKGFEEQDAAIYVSRGISPPRF